jgi:prevent-host-death family protein
MLPIDQGFPPEGYELSISKARAHLPELVDRVRHGDTVYLSRYGKRVAALVPADAAEYLEHVEDEYWVKRAEEALARNEFVPWEQVVAELEALDAREEAEEREAAEKR